MAEGAGNNDLRWTDPRGLVHIVDGAQTVCGAPVPSSRHPRLKRPWRIKPGDHHETGEKLPRPAEFKPLTFS